MTDALDCEANSYNRHSRQLDADAWVALTEVLGLGLHLVWTEMLRHVSENGPCAQCQSQREILMEVAQAHQGLADGMTTEFLDRTFVVEEFLARMATLAAAVPGLAGALEIGNARAVLLKRQQERSGRSTGTTVAPTA